MSEEQGYNGWKNYETWAAALWIDNDRGSYEMARELRDDARQGARDDHESYRTAEGLLADQLKDWLEESMFEWEPEEVSLFTDLLHAAFSEVDWYEIAANMLSESVS